MSTINLKGYYITKPSAWKKYPGDISNTEKEMEFTLVPSSHPTYTIKISGEIAEQVDKIISLSYDSSHPVIDATIVTGDSSSLTISNLSGASEATVSGGVTVLKKNGEDYVEPSA